jgi:hypothetical protein
MNSDALAFKVRLTPLPFCSDSMLLAHAAVAIGRKVIVCNFQSVSASAILLLQILPGFSYKRSAEIISVPKFRPPLCLLPGN